ncbi:MAG: HAD family hydrolase [Chloroflexota bacterium]|nr:MAG: haloacid dehalogenase [Chloroflexota bacterium]
MPADYDVITFDCYGTLIDWESGIRRAFGNLAEQAGVKLDTDAALEAYQTIEPEVQAESFRRYREVLAETARRVAAQLGWPMDDDTAARFAATLPDWPPFPDTNPALERIAAAGYRLGILSNVDDDLLEGTLQHLTVTFPVIVTAEQVGSYKPAHGHFLAARERIGGLRWLHAAQSHFHDITPAGQLGLPAVWVNRKREALPPGGPAPLAEVADLAGLADWLGV